MIERVGCSWQNEDRDTHHARIESPDAATWHDSHREDLTRCDSWLCVCGSTDSRGGTWETSNERGSPMEPTPMWNGHVTCTNCGRVYNREGIAIKGPDNS